MASGDFYLLPGEQLNGASCKYQVEAVLGQGCFGEVAKCLKLDTKEMVAIKVLKDQSACFREAKHEVSMLKKLSTLDASRSNIVQWHDCFLDGAKICLVFEMLDISFSDYMKRRQFRPLALKDIRPFIQQLATAFSALKSIGVIHTDLKPDNIMLADQEGQPMRIKLIDFGLAMTTSKAKPGAIVQARPFRAPEIFLGLCFSEAIDIWSLGCVAAFCYLGCCLYLGRDDYDMVRCIVETQGQPGRHLLDAGTMTSYFFNRNFSDIRPWVLKTPSEYEQEMGIRPVEDRELIFHSLDELGKFKRGVTDMAVDKRAFVVLLKRMLQLDPGKRITPGDILASPFIKMNHLDRQSTYGQSSLQAMDSPWIRGISSSKAGRNELTPATLDTVLGTKLITAALETGSMVTTVPVEGVSSYIVPVKNGVFAPTQAVGWLRLRDDDDRVIYSPIKEFCTGPLYEQTLMNCWESRCFTNKMHLMMLFLGVQRQGKLPVHVGIEDLSNWLVVHSTKSFRYKLWRKTFEGDDHPAILTWELSMQLCVRDIEQEALIALYSQPNNSRFLYGLRRAVSNPALLSSLFEKVMGDLEKSVPEEPIVSLLSPREVVIELVPRLLKSIFCERYSELLCDMVIGMASDVLRRLTDVLIIAEAKGRFSRAIRGKTLASIHEKIKGMFSQEDLRSRSPELLGSISEVVAEELLLLFQVTITPAVGGNVSTTTSAVGGDVSTTTSAVGGDVTTTTSAVGGDVSTTTSAVGGDVTTTTSAVGGDVSTTTSAVGGDVTTTNYNNDGDMPTTTSTSDGDMSTTTSANDGYMSTIATAMDGDKTTFIPAIDGALASSTAVEAGLSAAKELSYTTQATSPGKIAVHDVTTEESSMTSMVSMTTPSLEEVSSLKPVIAQVIMAEMAAADSYMKGTPSQISIPVIIETSVVTQGNIVDGAIATYNSKDVKKKVNPVKKVWRRFSRGVRSLFCCCVRDIME